MSEPNDTAVCHAPLPIVYMTREQQGAVIDCSNTMAALARTPGFKTFRNEWWEKYTAALSGLRQIANTERVTELRNKASVAMLPETLISAIESFAQTAESTPAIRYTRAPIANEKDAIDALKKGEEADAMVKTVGWSQLSLLLAGMVWAADCLLPRVPAESVPYVREMHTHILTIFDEIQAAIDRGIVAAAWLTDVAEREREE